MGRNMFGPCGGAWGDGPWTGWWGDNPPYHYPVFIVTHHPRDPVEMEGGTTFHFVTDGIESALEQAREAAGAKTSCFGAAARSSGSIWRRDCWTSSSSTLFRFCSVTVSHLRQPRERGYEARAGPGSRGAWRHPPQVPVSDVNRLSTVNSALSTTAREPGRGCVRPRRPE